MANASGTLANEAPAMTGVVQATDTTQARIVEAALDAFAQFGISKTTLEDIAQRAGCSRATLYRHFPGKQALLRGVVQHEVRRVGAGLDRALADVSDLEDVLAAILTHVGREFAGHDALQHVLEVEPEVILPHVIFDGAERLYAVSSAVLAPHLEPYVGPGDAPGVDAAGVGEWLARLAVSYLLSPSDQVSLTDEDSVRRLVCSHVLPGLRTATTTT